MKLHAQDIQPKDTVYLVNTERDNVIPLTVERGTSALIISRDPDDSVVKFKPDGKVVGRPNDRVYLTSTDAEFSLAIIDFTLAVDDFKVLEPGTDTEVLVAAFNQVVTSSDVVRSKIARLVGEE